MSFEIRSCACTCRTHVASTHIRAYLPLCVDAVTARKFLYSMRQAPFFFAQFSRLKRHDERPNSGYVLKAGTKAASRRNKGKFQEAQVEGQRPTAIFHINAWATHSGTATHTNKQSRSRVIWFMKYKENVNMYMDMCIRVERKKIFFCLPWV